MSSSALVIADASRSSDLSRNGEHREWSKLPLNLYLSPTVPSHRAAAFIELASKHPRIARLVDAEEGALCVLADFETQELPGLLQRRRRVVGLPFAERLLHQPEVLSKVHSLPIFDLLYRSGAICCSGLYEDSGDRCRKLAKWLGAKYSDEIGQHVGLLVTSRASCHPGSKYQAAVKARLPIVRPTYLEAMWREKNEVDLEPHLLPALSGIRVYFDQRLLDTYRQKAKDGGALIEDNLNNAEVLLVQDVTAPLYPVARAQGMITAPPLWIDRCLQLRCCVPVAGDLEVLNPQSLPLVISGGSSSSTSVLALGPDDKKVSSLVLADCILCLLYLPAGRPRDVAKALAWRCGAFTTLEPASRDITHVMFQVEPKSVVYVSVNPAAERVYFMDMSWLEACAIAQQRLPETSHVQQEVCFRPVSDTALPEILRQKELQVRRQGRIYRPVRTMQKTPRKTPRRKSKTSFQTPKRTSRSPLQSGDEAPCLNDFDPAQELHKCLPTSQEGIFKAMVIGLIGWSSNDTEAIRLREGICSSGGTVISMGALDTETVSSVDLCICGGPAPSGLIARHRLSLATASWAFACLAEGVRHDISSFPHFVPSPSQLPLRTMTNCNIRITAVDSARHRARLEELVRVLGAKVAQQGARVTDLTHVVAVDPRHLEGRTVEVASRKGVPVVSVQWLFDSYTHGTREPESGYRVNALSLSSIPTPEIDSGSILASTASFNARVLSGHVILISPFALGSDPKLPEMAEELGASVQIWKTFEELLSRMKSLKSTNPSENSTSSSSTCTVVLLDEREVGGLESLSEVLEKSFKEGADELRKGLVQPAWLREAFQQRRRLPLEAFSVMKKGDSEPSEKRARISEEDVYAWEHPAMNQWKELAETSRGSEMLSKAQEKVNEGLRLAQGLP